MKKLLILAALVTALAACGKKEPQGRIIYTLKYELPDSLKNYIYYLPKEATVYFKGDSTASVHQSADESTTIITNSKTKFMEALLKSPHKKYSVIYSEADQKEERAMMPIFTAKKEAETKKIAGLDATRYTLTDKMTGQTSEAWFTTAIPVAQGYMSQMFDPALGVPLVFSANQNGMITHTEVKEIKLEKLPTGLFSAPAGYEKITYQQLRDMPIE
jgi:hypothetical protein